MANTLSDPLLFPKDAYTVESKVVKTSGGEKTVTYRAYQHIPYVTKPVDTDYQSLDVYEPIKVDGKSIDASHAPLLFANQVGGYMSARNVRPRAASPRDNTVSSKTDLALAAGYVFVSPGCRGRDNQAADGTYYGKAPAAIVDLKAAIRYIKHNQDVIPGNVDWIISSGCSAGGALSSLIGASGNSPLYETYLEDIGAASTDDSVFASACFSPIIDLEHADMAYEWMYGAVPTYAGELVDQEQSAQLRALFAEYQASLALEGQNGYGTLTADNYAHYLLETYLFPSANKFLKALPDAERNVYLAKRPWISWKDSRATFTFADYLASTGRMKALPSFDDFAMKAPEPSLFGNETIAARHFTAFSLQHATGDVNAKLDEGLQTAIKLMNPMTFTLNNNPGCAKHWWLRHGAGESHISFTAMVNLACSLRRQNKAVNAWFYWDADHCEDSDPEGLIAWIGEITGYEGESEH